jgi:paraquat-inducible protein B
MSQDIHRTEAETRRSRWPGWIWAVPIAALLVVGWLAFRGLSKHGVEVTVMFHDAAGARSGDTAVDYRGLKVGQVDKVELTSDGGQVRMTLRLEDRMKPFLREGTRFWLEGANPSLSDLKSLTSVISGPTVRMQPGPGRPARSFVGMDRAPVLQSAPRQPLVPYVVSFDGDVGDLQVGAPVRLRGFTVGRVSAVRLAYDPGTDELSAPVTIALDPARIGLPAGRGRGALDGALSRWVARGLRAQLTQEPPVVGSRTVSLTFTGSHTAAGLQPGGPYPAIPTEGSGSIDDLTGKADRILTRIDNVPIERIGRDLAATADRVHALVASPRLQDSVAHLDSTLAEVDRTVHEVSPKVDQLVAQLRRAAAAAEQTAQAAGQVVSGSPASQDSDLPTALHELTETARSIRALADYLDRHPEALIKGRKGDRP